MKYNNIEKIKIAIENRKELECCARTIYTQFPVSYITSIREVMKVATGEQKNIDIDKLLNNGYDDIPNVEFIIYSFIKNILSNFTDEGFINEFANALKTRNINNNIIRKRLKGLRTIIKKVNANNYNFYTKIYTEKKKSFDALREEYRNNDAKAYLKRDFLRYIRNMDLVKKKQSQKYSVSRDLDKEVFYETVEGRLAKIKEWQLQKYQKKGYIDTRLKAQKEIAEGIFVKPMKLINKTLPKAQESMKLLLASCFEGIKDCRMIIDTDFKKAYDPSYTNHQDTDGDKASNYSCMSTYGNDAQNFYGKIEGCKVVRWELNNGEQVGRCIMYEWKGQRHFIRIYGRYEYHRTMINMLEAQMKEGDLFGRNCAIDDIKLPTNMDYDTKVMYLDGNYYGLIEESGKYYMIAHNYEFDCKTTGGEELGALEDDTAICERCGHREQTDEGIWVNDYFYCCCSCAEEDGWHMCERCGEWEHEDDAIWVEGVGYFCSESCAESKGYRRDTYYGEWIDEDELGWTEDYEYYTTESGAAEYYGVDEVEWNAEDSCWKKPEQEQEQEQTETGEEND